MASSKAAILDLDVDVQREAEAQLQFQEFSPTPSSSSSAPLNLPSGKREQVITFTSFPDTPGSDDEGDESKLLASQTGAKQTPSFLSFEYYQKFFDVETHQVRDRIIWSMVPRPGVNYLQHYIRPNPDIYGPFWICVTLVFTIAMAGNISNYLQTAASATYIWRYNFHQVTIATTAIFSYASMVPLLLWALLWWRHSGGGSPRVTLLELLCVYGYSLAIYIPVSILWVIQVTWVQWLLMVLAALLSGMVLMSTVWPAVIHEERRLSLAVTITVLLLHFALAAGFVLYFFHVPEKTYREESIVAAVTSSTSTSAHDIVPAESVTPASVLMSKLTTAGGATEGKV